MNFGNVSAVVRILPEPDSKEDGCRYDAGVLRGKSHHPARYSQLLDGAME
jgi:hypothetical protein